MIFLEKRTVMTMMGGFSDREDAKFFEAMQCRLDELE
jgi:hypothetical protein